MTPCIDFESGWKCGCDETGRDEPRPYDEDGYGIGKVRTESACGMAVGKTVAAAMAEKTGSRMPQATINKSSASPPTWFG